VANKHNGEVSITLDKPRTLKFDFNAGCEYEEVMGTTLNSFMYRLEQLSKRNPEASGTIVGNKEVRAMLYAALRHEDKTLTLEEAGNLFAYAPGELQAQKLVWVFQKVMESWLAAQGVGAKKNEKPETKKPEVMVSQSGISKSSSELPTGTSG
jgi:hypothetical protein